MGWFTILGLTLFIMLLFRNLARNRKQEQLFKASRKLDEKETHMPLNDARLNVQKLLSGNIPFEIKNAVADDKHFGQLGPVTKEFFQHYPHVQTKSGGFVVSVDLISQSTYINNYISIGHSEDWDIVQKPEDDQVFIVEGSEMREEEIEIRFPSIYHLILDEGRMSRGNTTNQ